MEDKALYNLAKETLRLDGALDQANEEIVRLRTENADHLDTIEKFADQVGAANAELIRLRSESTMFQALFFGTVIRSYFVETQNWPGLKPAKTQAEWTRQLFEYGIVNGLTAGAFEEVDQAVFDEVCQKLGVKLEDMPVEAWSES